MVCTARTYLSQPISGFKQFVDIFLGHSDAKSPYNYKQHFMGYLENDDDLDILFFKYEDLRDNLPNAVQNLINHLGFSQVSANFEKL